MLPDQKVQGGVAARFLFPPLFVVIWATGFIVARLVKPHADPLTFLMARYVLSAAVFTLMAVAAKAPWPRTVLGWRNAAISGCLIQALYLGAVFWAVRHGLPAGIAALIAGLQPLLTAMLSGPLLGERVGQRRWIGIALGFAGAVLVLAPQLGATAGMSAGVPVGAAAICIGGMAAITLGTIWQKRVGTGTDLRTSAAIQFITAAVVTAPVALTTEQGVFDQSLPLWAGLLWSVLGLSVGAISLLLVLIRRGAVAGVAALFYLVPPVAAVMAFALFNERLAPVQLAGMGLAVVGVALASRAGPDSKRR